MASLQNAAYAAMVTTQQLASEVEVQQQRDEIKNLFSRDDVKQELVARGVDPQAAINRVDSMTDTEIAQLHGKIDELPTGEGVLETVVIVLLILLLLEVTGVTDVFDGI
jgi:hypothetical protein